MSILTLLARLVYEFFKTGLFSIGGGMATLPFLADIADRTGWYTRLQLSDMLAVAQSTPGPIGVNVATYAGYQSMLSLTGSPAWAILGGAVATLAEVAPCVVVVLIVARILAKFRNNRQVEYVFSGLRPASTGLVAAALFSAAITTLFRPEVWQETGRLADLFDVKSIIFFVVLLAATRLVPFLKKLHPVWLIALSAVVGIVFQL